MILLLGKNELVEEYAKNLGLDTETDIAHYPDITTHYTEVDKYVKIAEKEQPTAITTQRLDMLDALLRSDLNIEKVIRVGCHKGKCSGSVLSKEEAWELRCEYAAQLM